MNPYILSSTLGDAHLGSALSLAIEANLRERIGFSSAHDLWIDILISKASALFFRQNQRETEVQAHMVNKRPKTAGRNREKVEGDEDEGRAYVRRFPGNRPESPPPSAYSQLRQGPTKHLVHGLTHLGFISQPTHE